MSKSVGLHLDHFPSMLLCHTQIPLKMFCAVISVIEMISLCILGNVSVTLSHKDQILVFPQELFFKGFIIYLKDRIKERETQRDLLPVDSLSKWTQWPEMEGRRFLQVSPVGSKGQGLEPYCLY